MHGKAPSLTADKREKIGTRYNNRLREQGKLPAVVYGHGQPPVSISLPARETLRSISKGEKIFRMELAGVFKDQAVLLKDVQYDYLGSTIVHADFARIDLKQRIRTKVPVHLIGEAKGLKEAGAIMMHPVIELNIECVVADLPEFIEVSVAELEVGHAITAADVKLPKDDMKVVSDPHAILAQIIIQQEIQVGEAAAATAEGAEPEVITAKKPAEGEEAAAGKAPAGKDAKAPAAKGAAPAKDAKAPAGKDAKPAGDKKK